MMLIYDMVMMCKETMVDLFGVLSRHLPGDTKGTEEDLSQDARCLGRKFKTVVSRIEVMSGTG